MFLSAVPGRKRARSADDDAQRGAELKRFRTTPPLESSIAFHRQEHAAQTLPLPLRPPTLAVTSPLQAPIFAPQQLTHLTPSPSSNSTPTSLCSSGSSLPDIDMADSPPPGLDVDVPIANSRAASRPSSPLHHSNTFLRPPRLNPQTIEGQPSGRIPTPITSNFYLGMAPRSVAESTSAMDLEQSHMNSNSNLTNGAVNSMLSSQQNNSSIAPITVSAPPPAGHRKQRSRELTRDHRMPSPISEDLDTPTHLAGSQFSKLSVAEGDSGMDLDILDPVSIFAEDKYQEQRPASPLSAASCPESLSSSSWGSLGGGLAGDRSVGGLTMRTGRARSGAILTEKRRFVMGFREDCVKCRQRVPGHFSHFLPD